MSRRSPQSNPQYSQSHHASHLQQQLPLAAPPPPPPPKTEPLQSIHGGPIPSPTIQSTHSRLQPISHPTNPPPPAIEEYWLPEIVQDKSKPDLQDLLSSASLLTALTNAPSTTHPSIPASLHPLTTALQTNTHLATNLNNLSSELTTLRSTLTTRLLSLHALERQWRNKQSELDQALEPWSPKALHARLVASIAEQEMLCRGLEESFLEAGEGKATEREVQEWIRQYRDGRMVLGLRKERRARFEEGRVGGWR